MMTKHQHLWNSYKKTGLSLRNRNSQTLTPKTKKVSWNIAEPIASKDFAKNVINY